MTSPRKLLADNEFLAGLAAADLETIASCGRIVHAGEGSYVFHEGEDAGAFYILATGRVALELHVPGRGPLVIDTISDGDVLGWSWLFPPHRWHFDARAVTDLEAVAFDASCLRTKLDGDPRLGYELMKRFAGVMNRRLQSARMRLNDMYGTTP